MLDKQQVLEHLNKFKVIEGTCWRFKGATNTTYGYINIDGETYKANRLSCYVFHNLDLNNPSKLALHKPECINKDCWNPEHLYVGNHSDNLYDRVKTGTFRNRYTHVTHCIHGHEFTPENTYIPKDGRRRCRQCRDINRERSRQKQPKLIITSRINNPKRTN